MSTSISEIKDALIVELRKNLTLMTLLNDTSLTIEDGNIYRDHVSDIPKELITYPCISIIRIYGGDDTIRVGKDIIIQIDVWSKKGNAESLKILDLVDSIINNKKISYNDIYIAHIQNFYGSDDYETLNYTSHSYNKYRIKAT